MRRRVFTSTSPQVQARAPEILAMACFHHVLDRIPRQNLADYCLRFAGRKPVDREVDVQWDMIKKNMWMDGVICSPNLVYDQRVCDGEDDAVADSRRMQVSI